MLPRWYFYLLLIAVLAWLSGCESLGRGPGRYAGSALATSTAYKRAPDRATAQGVIVSDYPDAFALGSTSGPGPVGLANLDAAIDATEACLYDLPEPSPMESRGMGCLWNALPRVVDRTAFEILIPPNWYRSACTGQELFPCDAPTMACDEKAKIEPAVATAAQTPALCPCNCRATVQDDFVIVAVPNAGVMNSPEQQVMRGELLRLVTACNNIWNGPLARCAVE